MTEQTIELQILASDFKHTRFKNPCNCAISKAAKRCFKTNDLTAGVEGVYTGCGTYYHEPYEQWNFNVDRAEASKAKFSPQHVIRTITLTKA